MFEAYQQARGPRPLQFVIYPTYTCNLSCNYCFQSSQLHAQPAVLTRPQVDDLFAAVREISATRPEKTAQIVLFGGEPLLPTTETAVGWILDRAAEAGHTVQIVTNGTHLPRFAGALRRHREILTGAQITLDGPQEVHDARRKRANGGGSYDNVMRAVEVCLEVGLEVKLRVNLDAQNIGSLADLASLLEDRGWARRTGFQCYLAPVTDHVGTSTYPFLMREDELVEPVLEFWRQRPELKEVLDFRLFRVLHHLISVMQGDRSWTLPRFHYCEVDGGEMFSFGPDNLIYQCPESVGDAKSAVGTYSPRFELWPRRLQAWQGRSVLTLPECQQCSIATFCGGGCAYAALRRLGRPSRAVCGDAPGVIRAYMRFVRRQFQNGALPVGA